MIWHEIWPKQRANARRKKITEQEREYRKKVRKNKTKAALKASNDRLKKERAERAKARALNAARIRNNEKDDDEDC